MQARRDYPEETANTVFADTSTFHGRRTVKKFFKKSIPAWWQFNKQARQSRKHFNREIFYAGAWKEKDKSLICINPTNIERELKGTLKNLYFVFNHELGHIILPNAYHRSWVFDPPTPEQKKS